MLDGETCYRAMSARDARFDGVFFVGVATTGVYCRPVCPARTPRRDRCTFHPSAAAAERAGFRACLRCRPELAPGLAPIDATPRLVARAVAQLDEVARGEASVARVAHALGVSDRHLRRVVEAELGVSPIELVASRRLALARQLVLGSHLSLAQVALASGFGSVRRFNDAFRASFGRTPSSLRRSRTRAGDETTITLRLAYRPPLAWRELLAFLGARTLPGLEHVDGDVWSRAIDGAWIRVTHEPVRAALRVEVPASCARDVGAIAAKVRAIFDLDAAPSRVDDVLAGDPLLAPAIAARPGLRVPGAWDGFELAVRAVLGQQVSVAAARTLATRVMRALGEDARRFPDAPRIARAGETSLVALGIMPARARTLVALARAVDAGDIALGVGADPERTTHALRRVPGIGAWTAAYVAMRALRWPDALVAGDLVLRRGLGERTDAGVTRRTEAWRPWRAYGVMHVWAQESER